MKPAGQVTLTLTEELETFVRAEVKRGAFASMSEYVREVLRQRYVEARDREDRLRAFDEALRKGLAEAEAGDVVEIGEAFRLLRQEQAERTDASSADENSVRRPRQHP